MIRSIVLKLAGRCNLNCSYCYVYNREDRTFLERPKLIRDETFDAVLRRIGEYCDRHRSRMRITFHGGEPMLVGAERLDRLAARAREVLGARLGHLSMQTNATLIDDRWIEVFERRDIGVGVSLDGPPEIHDACRVDHQGRGSYARTVRGIRRLRAAGREPGILCVVNPAVSGVETYRHFRQLGIRSMSFLLPDVSHDTKLRYYGGLGRAPVADYLIPIFDAWFDEDDPKVKVRLFRDLLMRIFGGHGSTDTFGNPKMGYLVVETDGSIEALDALRACEHGIAKSGLNVREHGFDDLAKGLKLAHRAVSEGIPLCATCRGCRLREVCGGGYLPHRYARHNGFDNPSVWCADIKLLIDHMRERAGLRRAA